MLFRVYFEPVDIDVDHIDDQEIVIMKALLEDKITVSKIISIDKDGFPIKQ
jgi:hypothetical protein